MTASNNPLALFRNRDFLALWLAGAVSSTVRWLEMLATSVYVFDLTASPFTVALLMVLRLLPLALFGAVSGVFCERFDRRRVLLVGIACMIVVSMVLGLLASADMIQLWHIGLGAFLNGLVWTTDMPARRTLLGESVATHRVGPAMSLDSVTGNGTRMLGPLLGGLLLQTIGLDGTFYLGVGFYLLGYQAVIRLPRSESTVFPGGPGVWRSILQGIGYIRGNRSLVGILSITVIFNLWGFPFTAMVPVIGRDVLELSPFMVGLLASTEGAGALLGAILITFFSQPRWYHGLYFFGTITSLSAVLLFSRMEVWPLAALCLLIAGLGLAAFATMQSTLVFLAAPPEVRGRIMGVLSVCIGTGPIGFLHLGMLADWLGAPTALTIIALEGLAAMVLVRLWISSRSEVM